MELRHLRYFIAVAEERHITRAAERLGMQQPPLSQQIAALERELDARLFRRLPRGVELTQAGEAFLAEARAALAQIDHAALTARRTARGELGRIAIGFTSSTPFHPLMPRAINSFREAFPGVSLALDEGGTDELIDDLRAERIDAAFIRSPVADPLGVAVLSLTEEEMVLAVPSGHRLARATKRAPALALASLAAETFILYRRAAGTGLHDAITAACHRAGFSPIVGQEAPRIVATLNLVAAGLGLSFVPASLQRMQMEGVAFRRLRSDDGLVAPLSLAIRRGDGTAALRHFIDSVRRAARTLR